MSRRVGAIILTAFAWAVAIMIILFSLVPAFQVGVDERMCQVEQWTTEPAFDCSTRCSPGKKVGRDAPTCGHLEEHVHESYDPLKCHFSKWRFEDLLCPDANMQCDGGYRGLHRHTYCEMTCPLTYNVTLVATVEGVEQPVQKNRIINDRSEWHRLDEHYKAPDPFHKRHFKCQVKRGEDDFMWEDESVNLHFAWWKWLLLVMVLGGAVAATAFLTQVLREEEGRSGHRHLWHPHDDPAPGEEDAPLI